jgi:hypothetical protein
MVLNLNGMVTLFFDIENTVSIIPFIPSFLSNSKDAPLHGTDNDVCCTFPSMISFAA